MSFNWAAYCRLGFFAAGVAIATIGCAREAEKSSPPIRVKVTASGDCLTSLRESVSKFVNAKMTDAELSGFWNCTEKAVTDYKRLTRGEVNPDAYGPEGIRSFLHKYFFQDEPISSRLMFQLMHVKRVLLGGNVEIIERRELDELERLIRELKSITLEMQPHLKILFGDEVGSEWQRLAAAENFRKSLTRIGDWLSQKNQSYAFANMLGLIEEISRLSDGEGSWANTLNRGFQVLPRSKNLLIGGDEQSVAGAEWSELMSVLGQGFEIYLEFKLFSLEDLSTAMRTSALPNILQTVAELLSRSLDHRESKSLPISEVDALIEDLAGAGWMPEILTAEGLKTAFRWISVRLLNSGNPTSELRSRHFWKLKAEARRWRDLMEPVGTQSPSEFDRILSSSQPMTWDSEGRLLIDATVRSSGWTPENRSYLVWPYIALRWVLSSFYGSAAKGVSEGQLEEMASEVLPVFHAFNWFTSIQPSIAKRLLREADLFTLASDGDRELTLKEATRYLVFIMSGYRAGQVWLKLADAHCQESRDSSAECYRDFATHGSSDVLSPLPRLQQVARTIPDEFGRYMRLAEEIVLDKILETRPGTGDLLQVWMLFQYVETFLRLYDRDENSLIRVDESLVAFERYGTTLAVLLSATGLPESEIQAFFTYLMRYGETPFTMWGGQVRFNYWKWHRNEWSFQADRSRLMTILNELSKL